MAELKLENIWKTYNKDIHAVKNFNLHIKDKEFIVLVGPSGCGKSTILRLIAGLEQPTEGTILMDGKLINKVPPKNRDIAFVFQNYALYPHMTVYENMAFGLKCRKFSKSEINRRIKEAAQLLDLQKYLDRKPASLSGGQRQRVALGRAIVRDPKVFLMDEPLSNLDAKLRAQMRIEITKLHQRLQPTTLYVTHDQTEAMTMATRLVVINNGEIQQVGSPENIYERPDNVFVGSFIGSPPMNFFKGILIDDKIHIGQVSITVPKRTVMSLQKQGYANKEILMGIRPEDLHAASDFQSPPDWIINVKIEMTELLGAEHLMYSQIDGQPFIARMNGYSKVQKGQIIQLSLNMNKAHFFDCSSQNRISIY